LHGNRMSQPICRSERPLRPRPPPFPYTTLFRSLRDGERRQVWAALQTAAPLHVPHRRNHLRGDDRRNLGRLFVASHVGAEPDRTDRKSTRLNSSHVKISYAVFCLKKKNAKSEST